jgi:hypothetical protein
MQYCKSKHAKSGKCQDHQLDLAGMDIIDAADLIRAGRNNSTTNVQQVDVNERGK